jgi:iron complex outermembrane receptor protein
LHYEHNSGKSGNNRVLAGVALLGQRAAGRIRANIDQVGNVNKIRIGRTACSLAACAAAMAYGAAQGQNQAQGQSQAVAPVAGLQDVVVTAERRTSNVQKTAVSISVRKGDDLKKQGRYTLQDILQDVPGVVAGPTTDTVGGQSDNQGSAITIRGLAANGLARGGIVATVPAVAVYADDVYEGLGSDYDISRVEVLRGPQGTLYGRSATAGVVAFHTNDPKLGQYGGDASIELGNYGLEHYTGAVNVPLGDQLALRVSANRYSRQGYYSADGTANSDTAARVKLLYKPSDELSVLLGAQLDNRSFHTGGVEDDLNSPNNYTAKPAFTGPGVTRQREVWAEVNWNAGPVVLTYVPAYRTFEEAATLISAGPLPGGLSQPDDTPSDHFLTQELRLSSAPGSKMTWQTGAFYYNNPLTASTSLVFNQSQALVYQYSNQRLTENAGVFGEATYPFADNWRFTGGLRYDYTHVRNDEIYSLNVNGFPFPANPPILDTQVLNGTAAIRNFDNVTYKARIEHDLTPVNMMYGMVSSAFLPGDLQITTGAGNVPAFMDFKSETVTSFELGSKNRFLDRTLQVNADAFYYIYSGYQTDGIDVSSNPMAHAFETMSVPARMYGGELEITYRPTVTDQFELDYSYVNAHLVNEPAIFLKYSGQTNFNNVVPHTVNVAYTHNFELADGSNLSFRGDARYLSGHTVSQELLTPGLISSGALPYATVGGEVIGDFNAVWTSSNQRYSITGYIRNVGDNRYKTNVLVQSITPSPADVSETPYDPRTFGMILSMHI